MCESRVANTCRDGREHHALVSGRRRCIRPHLSEINDQRASRHAEWGQIAPPCRSRFGVASLPLSSGGLGLRSATRLRGAAHWASWADSLKMVFDRHPDIARRIVRGLEGHHPAPSIQAVLDCTSSLTRDGFRPPPWEDLMQQELKHYQLSSD